MDPVRHLALVLTLLVDSTVYMYELVARTVWVWVTATSEAFSAIIFHTYRDFSIDAIIDQ